ncbi:MAG: hypothetical protein SFV18_18480 [Bryobacteraceae bacterium]|nr:hypothetical protein [Bryobacteraceae bacterium]
MRRLILLAAILASLSCRRRDAPATIEGPPETLMFIRAADPKAAAQFVAGFHAPEQKAWRWTMGKFSVKLRPPFGASQNGARLRLNFTAPEPVIAKFGKIALAASVGPMKLDPETYSKAGTFAYVRDVPAAALMAESVTVEFALDKFFAAGEIEQRELGIIVASAGFEKK